MTGWHAAMSRALKSRGIANRMERAFRPFMGHLLSKEDDGTPPQVPPGAAPGAELTSKGMAWRHKVGAAIRMPEENDD